MATSLIVYKSQPDQILMTFSKFWWQNKFHDKHFKFITSRMMFVVPGHNGKKIERKKLWRKLDVETKKKKLTKLNKILCPRISLNSLHPDRTRFHFSFTALRWQFSAFAPINVKTMIDCVLKHTMNFLDPFFRFLEVHTRWTSKSRQHIRNDFEIKQCWKQNAPIY